MSTDAAPYIFTWTGHEVAALMEARRMTNEAFAEHLGVSVRSVATWRAKPSAVPRQDMQKLLDASYELLLPKEVRRFVHVLKTADTGPVRDSASPVVMAAEMTLMQARIEQLQAELTRNFAYPPGDYAGFDDQKGGRR
ncbi:hypothetical protein [Streptomyces sp. 061-3]|uniref:hypothetical protein n=1 Tax=Streptomyces sp. 061-3 TaxID=2789268 RepID=UPI0039801D5F